MKSRLQIAGHPIHAMVVAYPIALYTASLVCDLLYLAVGKAFWFQMAFWAIVFGLVTHVAAAATGLPDFLAVVRAGQAQKDARRTAASHLVFGIGLLIVQGLNLGVRNLGQVPASGSIGLPVAVNVIAVAVLGIQGWYGGELVYRHLIGVTLPDATEPEGRHKGKKHG
jgi:uncharacterized membrane protein